MPFTQQMGRSGDANPCPTVSIGQTRNGKDEWITPITIYEFDPGTGLYFPPGVLNSPAAPRFNIADSSLTDALKATATEATLDNIAGKDFATQATLNTLKTDLESSQDASKNLKVSNINGIYTTPTHAAVSVGTSSAQALAANANRKYALLQNDSDTDMYISLGASAALHQGVLLKASGGFYEMSEPAGNLYRGLVNVISTASGKNIMITEGV
jgi:hypothetical protein